MSITSHSILVSGWSYAIIHHTAGAYWTDATQQMRNIQSYPRDFLGWADICYNFLIGGDGQEYEGHGLSIMGAHASIGISFIATAKDLLCDSVSRVQMKSNFIWCSRRQVGSTKCRGNNL